MRYLFIVNPVAGKREAERAAVPAIREYFETHSTGAAWQIVRTDYPGHAKELAREAAQGGEPVRICACGGDGTLSETVSGAYMFPNAEFAVYPCGSGNDFIKCFGDAEHFRSIQEIVDGTGRPIDLLKVNDYICMNLVSVGIDADVANAMNRWRGVPLLRGPVSYDLAVAECLLKPLGKRMRLRIGEEQREGSFMLAAAGNGKVYGGHYMATPNAKVDDGIIDLIAVDKIPLTRIMKVLGVYQRGEHLQPDGQVAPELRDCLRYYRTDHIEIESERSFVVNVDGEILRTDHVTIEMMHHKIRFVVPAALVG